MEIDCPKCGQSCANYGGYSTHFGAKHDGHPLVALHGEKRIRELYSQMSENALADELNVGRRTVERALRSIGVSRRSQSEAEKLKNDQMTEKERREQTAKAREKNREKYGDGGSLGKWVEENPQEHQQVAQQAASLGAPARDKNGMKGVTGQDHPAWRGGKSLYHAVIKQLHGPSWRTLRKRHRGDECEMCGKLDRELHLHHIIPVLSGGTNEPWNFLTLCETCHTAVEWRTREFVDSVLIE